MTGFMAAVALPESAGRARPDAADALRDHLLDAHGIEVDIQPFAGRLWLRLSAYLYNTPADYERLADVLRRAL